MTSNIGCKYGNHYRRRMDNTLNIDSCIHLGNKLCINNNHVCIDHAVTFLKVRLNTLIADFTNDSNTLSSLSKAYCMNIYGSQMWKFYNKHLTKFYTAWRKTMRQLWRIPYRTNNLILLINNSYQ